MVSAETQTERIDPENTTRFPDFEESKRYQIVAHNENERLIEWALMYDTETDDVVIGWHRRSNQAWSRAEFEYTVSARGKLTATPRGGEMVPSQAEFIDWMEFIYEIDITADKIHVMWYDDDGWSEESLEAAEKFDITFDLEFN